MSEEPRRYRPQGACRDILTCRDEVIVTVGPAGTGKTRAVATKIFLRAEKYPGSRHLICRQTRKSCTDTCLVSWENDVLPTGHSARGRIRRENRHSYMFPNGSEVVVGGLDDPNKLFSSEWDTIWPNEAIEISKDSKEILQSRLRNGKCAYHQLILDTNPGPPSHWIKDEIDAGKITCIETTHRDNPRYFNEELNEWTEEGIRYMGVLQNMTGARYDRLFLGLWSNPEGAVFPMLDPRDMADGGHRFSIERLWSAGIPAWATKCISIDHGTGSPYAGLWHLFDREGNVYTFREDYGAGYTADVQAERVIARSPFSEIYYGQYLDPSMKDQDTHARGIKPGEQSAAEIYEDAFSLANKERLDEIGCNQFGSVIPGARIPRHRTFAVLQKLLNLTNGFSNWYIEYSCENLWKELLSAAYKKVQTTGLYVEDLDPKCLDHALTSSGFCLTTHYQLPAENKKSVLDNFDTDQYNKNLRQKDMEDSEREFNRRHRTRTRI